MSVPVYFKIYVFEFIFVFKIPTWDMNLCLLLNFLHEIWISLWCNSFLYQISNLVYSCLFLSTSICFFMLEIQTWYMNLFYALISCIRYLILSGFYYISQIWSSLHFGFLHEILIFYAWISYLRSEFFNIWIFYMKSEFIFLRGKNVMYRKYSKNRKRKRRNKG